VNTCAALWRRCIDHAEDEFVKNVLADARTSSLFWRALTAFLVLPGIVTVVVPWLLLPAGAQFDAIALPVVLAGTGLLLWCVAAFYMIGRGTLAPWHPPQRLVVTGLYRFSRNPMYVAVLIVLAGLAMAFHSLVLSGYALLVACAFELRVVRHEEPWLARTFGAEWVAYRARVPRWCWSMRLGSDGRHDLSGET
jgi:protein-S-isoprenylcysteine O-methyltransferase Ste14